MRYRIIQISGLLLCINTMVSMDISVPADIPVMVKNNSNGLINYNIYAQIVPTLKASQSVYEKKLIQYGRTETIGMLSSISDIAIKSTSLFGLWYYNKNILDAIKQEALQDRSITGKGLQLIVSASATGFYISYYNWIEPKKSFLDYTGC